MTSRVFMLMPHDKNLSDARRFGELVMLYDKRESRPSIWDPAFLLEALDRLQDYQYDPERDFVLLAGHMVPTVLFCCAIVQRWPKTRALCYDMISGSYQPKSLQDPATMTVAEVRVSNNVPGANISHESIARQGVQRDQGAAR